MIKQTENGNLQEPGATHNANAAELGTESSHAALPAQLTRREVLAGGAVLTAVAIGETASGQQRKPTLYQATQDFLATLDAEQKQKAVLAFNMEERLNWHYVPKERKGLHYKDMNPRSSRPRMPCCSSG